MRKTTSINSEEAWKRLVYYGEVFGFVVAWIVGVVLVVQAAQANQKQANKPSIDSFAEVGLGNVSGKPLK
ncbi:hypothetical protein [Aeoliella mucimassa]|uniref:Uncharacterized protein n=1 Tax=Aeoliella mucimassa TaxID=2527972 RepID=A0A518AWQ1_9BACT|nr:hypothetical protein [Aeoliella mucimassa]QDU59165.1 hypothetical protein Pan181_54060 [Aeoliella mucimassa]